MDASVVVAGISALATVCAAALSGWLLRESILLRRAQTEPAISLHLERGRHINLQNLVIQNYGNGPAFDLTWELSPSAAQLKQYGLDLDELKLLSGLEHMAPGQRIETFFGSALELLGSGCPPIRVVVRYKDGQGKKKCDVYTLDPSQFEGISEVGSSAEDSMAKSLEKIATEFSRITSNGQIRVAVSPATKPWLWRVKQLYKELDRQTATATAAPEVAPLNGETLEATAEPDETSAPTATISAAPPAA